MEGQPEPLNIKVSDTVGASDKVPPAAPTGLKVSFASDYEIATDPLGKHAVLSGGPV